MTHTVIVAPIFYHVQQGKKKKLALLECNILFLQKEKECNGSYTCSGQFSLLAGGLIEQAAAALIFDRRVSRTGSVQPKVRRPRV